MKSLNKKQHFRKQQSRSTRTGATLVEVLMSLLIFSVAISMVFSLFPLSILSALRATQLTNSKVMAENVVEQVRTNPALLRPWMNNTVPWVWRGEWQAGRIYALNEIVTPTIEPGTLTPVPNVLFRCLGAVDPSFPILSGTEEPIWRPTGQDPGVTTPVRIADNNVVWELVIPPGPWNSLPDSERSYVVDPLGRFLPDDAAAAAGGNQFFGFDTDQTSFTLQPRIGVGNTGPTWADDFGIRRTTGGFADFASALGAFSQGDSWTVLFDAVPGDLLAAQTASPRIVFPASVDLTGIPPINPTIVRNHRVVIIGLNGSRSVVRNIAGIDLTAGNNDLLLDAPLPEFITGPNSVRSVSVETFAPRYTYLMTVRDRQPARDADTGQPLFLRYDNPNLTAAQLSTQLLPDIAPQVTVVMMFNRSFDPSDEEIYFANFGASDPATMTGFTGETAVAGLLQPDIVRVAWNRNPLAEPPPLIREGNYLFDARNVIWYQILNVSGETDVTVGTETFKQVDITVDRAVEIRTPATARAVDVGRVIFLKGIVDIFEIQ